MAQFLTPLGLLLSDEGNFEALLPSGAIVAEEQGTAAVPFNLVPSAIALAGAVTTAGDVEAGPLSFNLSPYFAINSFGDLSLENTSFSFGLPFFELEAPGGKSIEITPFAGVLGVFGEIDSSSIIAPVAEFAQYLTPRGGIFTKEEADIYQPMTPLGIFVDSAFAFEFGDFPATNFLTPQGTLYAVITGELEQVLLPDGSLSDLGALHEVYFKRVEQYLMTVGAVLEKTDGENFQELSPFGTIVDNNHEFDEPVVAWEFAITSVIALSGVVGSSGDVSSDVEGPSFEIEGPLVIRTLLGALTISGDIQSSVSPWDLEGPALDIRLIQGALGISGDLQATVPADIPFNFAQAGAFTMRGALVLDPAAFDYAPGPPVPFDIISGPPAGPVEVHLNGAVTVAGQIRALTSFEFQTQPLLLTGVINVFGDLDAPFTSGWEFVQLGEISAQGVLTFAETRFRFEDFTEGLPRGWFVDGPFLETVPNPNYTQEPVIGAHFFRRYTWKGFDPAGTMVAASGSEQDCISQTLSVCQSRHENWRDLVR